jgi:hypothetical protein
MRIAFENIAAEYPVMVDRYCSDDRDNRQDVMMMSCAVWAIEHGCEVEVRWEPAPGAQARGFKAVFLVLFSVAAYALKRSIDSYRAGDDLAVIVCGPHAVSFPEHCFRAGADAVVGHCNRELFLTILDDLARGALKRRYDTAAPLASIPPQGTFRELGLVPQQSYMSVVSSTGCPYTCSFCTDATTPYAAQGSAGVLGSIASSDEPIVIFNDPTFGLGRQGEEVLRGLAGFRDRYFIAFTTASMLKRPPFRALLDAAGFVMVEVGIENINSPFAKNRNADFFEIFADCRFLVLVNYIFGLHPKDFDDATLDFLRELADRCPNVLPMIFAPFSLPETPLHQEHLQAGRLFDPSYLCVGNEILSMHPARPLSPAEYYGRLDALNDRIYDGHEERARQWITGRPGIPDARREVLLQMLRRQQVEAERFGRWSDILLRCAPDACRPFAERVLAEAVPDFGRYELAL